MARSRPARRRLPPPRPTAGRRAAAGGDLLGARVPGASARRRGRRRRGVPGAAAAEDVRGRGARPARALLHRREVLERPRRGRGAISVRHRAEAVRDGKVLIRRRLASMIRNENRYYCRAGAAPRLPRRLPPHADLGRHGPDHDAGAAPARVRAARRSAPAHAGPRHRPQGVEQVQGLGLLPEVLSAASCGAVTSTAPPSSSATARSTAAAACSSPPSAAVRRSPGMAARRGRGLRLDAPS